MKGYLRLYRSVEHTQFSLHTLHSVEIIKIYSQTFFHKKFVKTSFLLYVEVTKELISRNIFFSVRVFLVFQLCWSPTYFALFHFFSMILLWCPLIQLNFLYWKKIGTKSNRNLDILESWEWIGNLFAIYENDLPFLLQFLNTQSILLLRILIDVYGKLKFASFVVAGQKWIETTLAY